MLEVASFLFQQTSMVCAAAPKSIFSVSVYRGAKAALEATLGVALPDQPNFTSECGIVYMWSGPGSWLVFGADPDGFAAAKPYAAITDQTDGRAVFEISGVQVKSALAKLVPIDLHDDVFPAGSTALTLAGHINVQIWREAEDRFCLACFRSFATALYDALTTSCREFES